MSYFSHCRGSCSYTINKCQISICAGNGKWKQFYEYTGHEFSSPKTHIKMKTINPELSCSNFYGPNNVTGTPSIDFSFPFATQRSGHKRAPATCLSSSP